MKKRNRSGPASLLLLTLMLAAALFAALWPAGLAAAMTAPEIKLTTVDPPIDALKSSGGTSILLQDPKGPLELLDPEGKAWLRIDQQGAFKRGQSGNMELVRKETFYYIDDEDIDRAVTDRTAQPYPWQIAGTYGGKPFVMTGTFIPPRMPGVQPPEGGTGTDSAVKWVLIVLAIVLVGAWSVRRRRPGAERRP